MEEREIFVLDLSCLPFACINGFREHDSRIERLEQIVASHVPAMGMGSKTDSGADGGVGGDDGSTIVLKENAPTDLEAPCDPSTHRRSARCIARMRPRVQGRVLVVQRELRPSSSGARSAGAAELVECRFARSVARGVRGARARDRYRRHSCGGGLGAYQRLDARVPRRSV